MSPSLAFAREASRMTLHFMSDKELSRLEILRDLGSGRLTTSAAADLLGLERRQVQRLAKAYQEHGATALISKKRGRPSNRQMPTGLKDQVLELIRARYTDFGPTLAAESYANCMTYALAARPSASGWRKPASGPLVRSASADDTEYRFPGLGAVHRPPRGCPQPAHRSRRWRRARSPKRG
jgi:hypothetical protein